MEERNTLQKEIILRTLCKMREHPTAAMVYEAVHQNHPTISRSTVYRVLAKMAGEGKSCVWRWPPATAATTVRPRPITTPAAAGAARWPISRLWRCARRPPPRGLRWRTAR